MQISTYFSNKKNLFFIILFVLIIILGGSVFFIDQTFNNSSSSSVGSNLKGYAQLKQKFNVLGSTNQNLYSSAMQQFNILEDKTSSTQTKYAALAKSAAALNYAYGQNFDIKIYNLVNSDFNTFAKENFKQYYNPGDFAITCQSADCAKSPQPADITNIINEIKAEPNVPNDTKTAMVANLTSNGYTADPATAAWAYFMSAQIIKDDEDFTKAGINEKYFNEIVNYVKTKYPNEYSKLGVGR